VGKQVTKEVIKTFLTDNAEDIADDFGYLVIPKDPILNDEAQSHLRDKFFEFLTDGGYEI